VTKTTRQNSVLLIATLGVYFGLVLAGAPQVLSNAALTRTFDVRDEIELVDELDTNPDEKRSPVTASVQIYVEDVELFFANLARLKKDGKFDPSRDTFSVAQNTLLPCTDGGRNGRFTPIRFLASSEPSRPALETFSRGMVYGYSLGDCIPNGEFDVTAAESKFDISLDAKNFNVQVTVKKETPQRAIELVDSLKTAFEQRAASTKSELQRAIIRYTNFKTQNEQVFVTTRLPRSGLISLLSA
jgi:MFS superfamily sulfate permease-like transporter